MPATEEKLMRPTTTLWGTAPPQRAVVSSRGIWVTGDLDGACSLRNGPRRKLTKATTSPITPTLEDQGMLVLEDLGRGAGVGMLVRVAVAAPGVVPAAAQRLGGLLRGGRPGGPNCPRGCGGAGHGCRLPRSSVQSWRVPPDVSGFPGRDRSSCLKWQGTRSGLRR